MVSACSGAVVFLNNLIILITPIGFPWVSVRIVGVEIDRETPSREERGKLGGERVAQGGAVADGEVDEDVEGDGLRRVIEEDAVDAEDAGMAAGGLDDLGAVGGAGGIDGVDADGEEEADSGSTFICTKAT